MATSCEHEGQGPPWYVWYIFLALFVCVMIYGLSRPAPPPRYVTIHLEWPNGTSQTYHHVPESDLSRDSSGDIYFQGEMVANVPTQVTLEVEAQPAEKR